MWNEIKETFTKELDKILFNNQTNNTNKTHHEAQIVHGSDYYKYTNKNLTKDEALNTLNTILAELNNSENFSEIDRYFAK